MTDVNFINAYNEVILENFNAVLKQNFMFQTQIKFFEDQAKEVQSLKEKLNGFDEVTKERDNLSHQVSQLKNDVSDRDRTIQNASNSDADKHRLQTALNTQAKDIDILNDRIRKLEEDSNKQIEQFQEDTNSKQQYIKQLEEMLPNSKRKKLGLPAIIEEETVEDTKVVAIKEVKTPEKTPVKNDVMLKEVANGGTF
jgi:chromosome segregation ATPase